MFEREIADASETIIKNLRLDKLMAAVDRLENKEQGITSRTLKLLDLENMVKNKSSLTAEEKTVGFFKACLVNDRVTLKALAEGVAADGGYLVPDETAAMIVRDLATGNYMRNHVTVMPMQRDSLSSFSSCASARLPDTLPFIASKQPLTNHS